MITTAPRCTSLLLLAVVLSACSPDPTPEIEIPSWAKVAPQQVAEAKKHGVPVAFENGLGMRFVLIPAGTFLMGEEPVEGYTYDPKFGATISMPFYASIHEVTNGEYLRFRPEHKSGDVLGYEMGGDRRPVVRVSWDDAVAFAVWLSAQDPVRSYRLPTEAEWEWLCKAGTGAPYWWGDATADGRPPGSKRTEAQELENPITHEVGSHACSPWGLYDVHGNVREWCRDVDGPYPSEPTTDPVGPAHEGRPAKMCLRGGSWLHKKPLWTRATRRGWWWSDEGYSDIGFRLVSPLSEPSQQTR